MITQSCRYSPKVELALLIGDRRLALSHVGPTDITIRDQCSPFPPSDAKLVITVDDESETYNVFLPHGIPAELQKVKYL